ncbi:hypothetical protein CK203_024359 [Vitis vinifera]|uniref:Uncharacterized protein n=1 Tax=Vitis vinifera TaxID=29760 RepID=A0A438IYH9_VITVI|nr:hypothetical protein CK203_024359 [Vitis vinifera]
MNPIKNWHRLAKNSKFTQETSKLHASCYLAVNRHLNGLQPQATLLEQAVLARNSAGGDPQMDRDFLVQLWVVDRKAKGSRGKRKRKTVKYGADSEIVYGNQLSSQFPFGDGFQVHPVTKEKPSEQEKPVLKQPPLSQSVTGFLEPASPEEVKLGLCLASK